jgi:predicted DNA-binding protein (MmcQ/YjbR family)
METILPYICILIFLNKNDKILLMNQNLEPLKKHFLSKKRAWEDFPFGFDVSVFKVGKKMFGFIAFDVEPMQVNLKCDPEDAIVLRTQYPSIIPGYHMNKKHWITLYIDGTLPKTLIAELIDHSYDLVVNKMSKARRIELGLRD